LTIIIISNVKVLVNVVKTLSTLLNEERNHLETEIDNTTSIEQVVKLVQTKLDNLERIYIGQLNVAQIRLASIFLDTLRQSIGTLVAAKQTEVVKVEKNQITHQDPNFPKRLILKLLQALLGIGILASLFSYTKTTPSAWMGILLTLVLLGLELLQLDKEQENNLTAQELSKSPQPILGVDSRVFLDNLADALNTIDLAVAIEERSKHKDDVGIEEQPELLNFLQRLMGASFLDKPQMAQALVKLLPQILMEQGIRTQIYQPKNSDSYREYFDFEPSIDPDTQDYVTITPALLKGDRLLKRGRVIEPA
jgi:hypothetical protein